MNGWIRMGAVILITAGFVSSSPAVMACSCGNTLPPCKAYWNASAVFVGSPLDFSEVPVELGRGDNRYTYTKRLVRFAVETAYRGVEGTEVEVMTGKGSGNCGYPFAEGRSYLVYASYGPNNRYLSTSICSRTMPLAEAGEELEIIKSLAKAERGSIIYGRVRQYSPKSAAGFTESPMSKMRVIVEGEHKKVEVLTDNEGRYRVSGLPSGQYQVRLVLPEGLRALSPPQVMLSEQDCADRNFLVQAY